MSSRPAVVAFDVIETLFPLEPLRQKLEAVRLPGHLLETWFAQLLRNAFALSATGSYRPFRDLAQDSLNNLARKHGETLSEQNIEEILGTFGELDAYEDVAPAMKRLKEAGVCVVTLTNGSEQVTKKLLDRAQLTDYVDYVVSVDEVQLWKPRREIYLHCAQRVGVAPSEVTLVAAHGWDIHGAAKAGLGTGYVSRANKRFPEVMERPDYMADDLAALIDQILASKA